MKKVFIIFAAFLVCMLFVTGSARAVVIDPFDTTFQSQTGVGSTGPVAASEALGGFRTLTINSKSGPLDPVLAVLGLASPFDLLTLSNPTLTSSVAEVTWDGGGLGSMDEDLTLSFADAILLDFVSLDIGNVDFTVEITDTAANGADTATKSIMNAALGINVFAFNTFTNFAAVDFSSVQQIKLIIDSGAESDLSLRLFATREETVVPEPSTIILLGIGLAGLGGGYVGKRLSKS